MYTYCFLSIKGGNFHYPFIPMVETPDDVIPVLFLGFNVFDNLFRTTTTVADIDGEIFM